MRADDKGFGAILKAHLRPGQVRLRRV